MADQQQEAGAAVNAELAKLFGPGGFSKKAVLVRPSTARTGQLQAAEQVAPNTPPPKHLVVRQEAAPTPPAAASGPLPPSIATPEPPKEYAIADQLEKFLIKYIFEVLQRNQSDYIGNILQQLQFFHQHRELYRKLDIETSRQISNLSAEFQRATVVREFSKAAGKAEEMSTLCMKKETSKQHFMQTMSSIMELVGVKVSELANLHTVSFAVMEDRLGNKEHFTRIVEYTLWGIKNNKPELAREALELGFKQVGNILAYNQSDQSDADFTVIEGQTEEAVRELYDFYQTLTALKAADPTMQGGAAGKMFIGSGAAAEAQDGDNDLDLGLD